jgi:hypothetical protein
MDKGKRKAQGGCPLTFWRIYERDFPERCHVKAPRGFRFSLWSLFVWRRKKYYFIC